MKMLEIELTDAFWDSLAPFFSRREFVCLCGCGRADMDPDHILKMYLARRFGYCRFVVTSGFRCAEHNAAVGGSPTSSHPKGLASDLKAANSRERFFLVKSLVLAGFERIGIGPDFVHADSDPDKEPGLIWLY